MIPVSMIRHAQSGDQSDLAALMHFGARVHRHLGWRDALDFLGNEAFWVLESPAGDLLAALSTPKEASQVAWIRLYACADKPGCSAYWQALWHEAQTYFLGQTPVQVAALVLHRWMARLLTNSGFERRDEVVNFELNLDAAPLPVPDQPENLVVRTMQPEDLPHVAALDAAAFAPLWQNSLKDLTFAYPLSFLATVVERDEQIVAYQISTLSVQSLHISRLAVHPQVQGQGIGRLLCQDLLNFGYRRGIHKFSVNTQASNHASLTLYRHLGFQEEPERFPIYVYQFNQDGD